jgi:hypothetical protein
MFAPILMAPLFAVANEGRPTGQVEGPTAVETGSFAASAVHAVEFRRGCEPPATGPQLGFLIVLLRALSAWPT